MSEDLIIKHCSPTLAGIKTANLFNCPYSSRLECECDVRKLNKMFCKKGIKVLPLKFSNGKALIYIFRPSKLAVDLSDEYACKLLESQGYHSHDAARCIRELRHRLKDSTDEESKSFTFARVTSAPADFAPSATASAICSVLPVPLQNTTATLLILYTHLSVFVLDYTLSQLHATVSF